MSDLFSSKARAFVAIDALESDLRQSIVKFVLDHLDAAAVFGNDLEELRRRRDADSDIDGGLLTDYLYLRQAYDILLRHSQVLPRDLGEILALNVGAMDGFVAVRNRVMHGRPLRFDDLDNAYAFVGRFRSRYFPATAKILALLTEDQTWQPAFDSLRAPYERVLHNLPSADFDETGLIGRITEVGKVLDLLVGGRDRMLTLTGEGGIGKTALALEACYSLIDSADPPFEAVLWVSLKHERLTAEGVRTISDAVRDIAGATHELGRSLDSSFGGSLEELADYLSGLRALVVIDNLESAQGTEIVALYDALPESVSFLFTSRVGIGEIERRIPIGGLSDSDSILLLRKFASRRGQSAIARLEDDVARDVVRRLRNSPLAIRWYVLSVEVGKTPTDALRNQTELLRFCVDNVYEALSADAKLMLAILRTLDRPIAFDELAVVASVEIDTLRRAAQVLSQGSLLVRTTAVEVGAPDLLELSATARAYLPRVDVDSSVMSGVLDREGAYLRDREEARLAAARRVLDPNVVMARSAEDEPTAHLLRLALRLGRRGDSEGSAAQVSRARTLNPGYYEIDRVDAFIASNRGNAPVAVARYKDALSQCETDEERARVSFFLAGHQARNGHDIASAIPLAEFAQEVIGSADTAMALGNFYVWDKRYADGQELLEQALDSTESPKLRRIITTGLVDSWRRWGEEELTEKMPESAFEKGLSGAHTGKSLLAEGAHDLRLVDSVARALCVSARGARVLGTLSDTQAARLGVELRFAADDGRFRIVESWGHLVRAVAALPQPTNVSIPSSLLRDKRGLAPTERQPDNPDGRLVGAVHSARETYGFITHTDFPGNLFFHFSTLLRPEDRGAIRPGINVEFTHSQDEDGRDRAEQVVVLR